MLAFELGASKNVTTASTLVSRIVERGFVPRGDRPLLAVRDGSEALRKAVVKHFLDARIQRCLVQKERNLKRYLARGRTGHDTRSPVGYAIDTAREFLEHEHV